MGANSVRGRSARSVSRRVRSTGKPPALTARPPPATTAGLMAPLSHVPKPEARAAGLSLGVGTALMGVKFAAYLLTGSAVIFADAMESIVNVLAAGFAVYALYYAHLPADRSHPYGHGKIEFVSAG